MKMFLKFTVSKSIYEKHTAINDLKDIIKNDLQFIKPIRGIHNKYLLIYFFLYFINISIKRTIF